MASNQYKIVLVGDGRVGKTKWVNKLLTSPSLPSPPLPPFLSPYASDDYNFLNQDKYIPTLGVEVHPIHVKTNKGLMVFNIWDCAGQEKYGGLRDGYYILGHGAIVMFDSTNQESRDHVEKWTHDVRRVCAKNNSLPMVEVATKCDDKIAPPNCIGISTKENYNLLAPLLELVRRIRDDDSIIFL
jgi:GTP-binding nuclear protein Ran